jgi:hypothetical protein
MKEEEKEKGCPCGPEGTQGIDGYNKYYTPTIEEFYVGFEYEENNDFIAGVLEKRPPREWYKKILSIENVDKQPNAYKDLLFYEMLIKNKWVRVKYLDKEDIESLGWGNYRKSVMDWYEIKKDFRLRSGNHGDKWMLLHDRTNEFKTIDDGDICYNLTIKANIDCQEDTMFEGIIKNKSELKKLMIQLNIK